MNNKDRQNLLERLERVENIARINGMALSKLQSCCDTYRCPTFKRDVEALTKETENLLGEMKIIRLLINVHEN